MTHPEKHSALIGPSWRLPIPARNEVHIWRVVANETNTAVLSGYLSAAEHAHAKRFRSLARKAEFTTARGFLRLILSRYLDMLPGAIRFRKEKHGKPQLTASLADSRLTFNLSHSRGVILAAIACDQEVGIDVEFVQRQINFSEIAAIIFSETEYLWLSRLPTCEQQRNFFQCWTRKEAFLKAIGEGLSDRMPSCEVVSPSGANLALRVDRVADANRWTVVDLEVGDEFTAALATANPDCVYQLSDWPGDADEYGLALDHSSDLPLFATARQHS